MCRLGMPQRLGGKGIELTYQAFPMLISPDYFSVTYLLSFSSLASDQQQQMQYKKNLTFLLLLLKFTAVLLGISVRGASFVAQIHVKFCMTIFSNIKYYFQSNYLNPNRPQAAFVQLSQDLVQLSYSVRADIILPCSYLSSFQIILPLGRLPVCAAFYQHVNIWLCKFLIFSRCIRASVAHSFESKCRDCSAYVFKKNKSVQSASYLFILLGVPIEIHSECKAFNEICSLTDFLIWVFLCHLSFGCEPTMYIELEAWMSFSPDM